MKIHLPTINDERPPQPLFFRSNTGDSIEFWHTDLVPFYYELDDFQVRTPTDVIGQHIHLVKFDVTASDGAANGFNYEDGTLSPDEVRDRIHAANGVNNSNGGLYAFDPTTQFIDPAKQTLLSVKKCAEWYVFCPQDTDLAQGPSFQNWDGAQTTIQRWDTDPLLNNAGVDRTLRTVFTHDHFSPSTHQQVGLYAGLVVEPEGSEWFLPDGTPMNTRDDGGPTNWAGYIVTRDPAKSYREFMLEFQDLQLAYTNQSPTEPSADRFDAVKSLSDYSVWFELKQGTDLNGTSASPGCQPNCVPQSVREQFGAVGLVLSADATIGALNNPPSSPPGTTWKQVTNPLPDCPQAEPRCQESYRIRQDDSQAPWVYTASHSVWFELKQDTDLSGTSASSACQPNCVPQSVREQFAAVGLILSADATIEALNNPPPSSPGTTWKQVTNPLPDCPQTEPHCKGSYRIRQDANQQPLVYDASIHPGWASPGTVIAPATGTVCSKQNNGRCAPYPQLVSSFGGNLGTFSVNYRNEPTSLRVALGSPEQRDLGYVFRSMPRQDPDLNCQPVLGNPITEPTCTQATGPGFTYPKQSLVPRGPNGVLPWDPYTPLMRAYTNDSVQVRTLVGAHQQSHAFTMHGVKWLFEPSYKNSGHRSAQAMGLSEHFEMLFTLPPAAVAHTKQEFPFLQEDLPTAFADYFYGPSASVFGLINGAWGILRAYETKIGDPEDADYLAPLPNNPKTPGTPVTIDFETLYNQAEKQRSFQVVATTSQQALGGSLNYNPRATREGQQLIQQGAAENDQQKLFNGQELIKKVTDPNALMYVRKADLVDSNKIDGRIRSDVPIEPLILRAAAGEWIRIELYNALPNTLPTTNNDLDTCCLSSPFGSSPFGRGALSPIALLTSSQAGLHSQLVAYDVTQASGVNAGLNPVQTVAPQGGPKTYYFYAGDLAIKPGCTQTATEDCIQQTPMEFGATSLVPADLLLQHQKGLYGALIIEPEGSTWIEDADTRAAATVTQPDGSTFRHFVVILQNDLENGSQEKNNLASSGAVNYRFESTQTRVLPSTTQENAKLFANAQVGGDPETPIFQATAGHPSRFAFVFPGGTTLNSAQRAYVLTLHGHVWQEEPYTEQSTVIGDNPLSQWLGTQTILPYEDINVVLPSAGGAAHVDGDYLYSTYQQVFQSINATGTWGIFRVNNATVDVNVAKWSSDSRQVTVQGKASKGAKTVQIAFKAQNEELLQQKLVPVTNGAWEHTFNDVTVTPGTILTAVSSQGAVTTREIEVPSM